MAIFTAIAGYVTTALISAGLSTVVAGAVANIAVGAALLGVGTIISSATTSRPQTSTPQAQATLNQAAAPRLRGYGRAKLSGTRAFWDSKNGDLYQILMAHHGEIDAWEQFYVGDKAVSLDENGDVASGIFINLVRIQSRLGTAAQGAYNLASVWGTKWTEDHRLRGIATIFARFKSPPAGNFQKVFPDAHNTAIRGVARLSKVYDPRTGATGWSDTAALCIMDYLTHSDGYRLSIDDIDLPSFSAKADVDEEAIPLAGGGAEKRYRLWGIYSLTDDPQNVLAKMRATCDAELYQTAAGKIAIRGGQWQVPTVTLDEADILSHSMEQGNNRFAAFNKLKILYTSKDHDYQTVEAPAWQDLADQAERGVLASELDLDMVPSPSQARRLAKIHIAKANPAWKGTITANLSALNALGERTIRLKISELSIDDAFFIAGFTIRPDLTGVEISVISISEAAYTWTTAEEGESAPIPQDTSPDLDFPIPENLSLSETGGVVTATVTAPGRDDLEFEAEIRAGAGALWQPMQSSDQITAVSGELDPGTYQVQARWRLGTTVGDWTFPLSEITIV